MVDRGLSFYPCHPSPMKIEKIILSQSNIAIFQSLDDGRQSGKIKYSMFQILIITLAAIMGGAESIVEICNFAKTNKRWFTKLLDLKNGIPSHDTIARVLELVNADQFEKAFIDWMQENLRLNKNKMIIMDGKSVRGTSRDLKIKPLHLLNIYSQTRSLVIGQRKAITAGGEITAANDILELLDLKNVLITVDAGMLSQKFIQEIDRKGGTYLVPIKGGVKLTRNELKDIFSKYPEKEYCQRNIGFFEEKTKTHGREDERYITSININQQKKIIKEFQEKNPGYPHIQTIARIVRIRKTKHKNTHQRQTQADGVVVLKKINEEFKTTEKVYYYISSEKMSAKKILEKIKSHWDIESNLHYLLDVALKEDAMKVRNRIVAQNLSLIRKMGYNLIRQSKSGKDSFKSKVKMASWSTKILEKFLLGL